MGGSSFVPTWYLIEKQQHVAVIRFSDTEVYKFKMDVTPKSSRLYPLTEYPMTVRWNPLDDTQGSLEALDYDSTVRYTGGEMWEYGIRPFEPKRFRLTLPDGRAYVLDTARGLESMTDVYGRTVSYDNDGIHHSSGVSITFTRGAGNRIETITDDRGREVTYHYGPDGTLEKVIQSGDDPAPLRYLGNYACQQGMAEKPVLKKIKAPDGTVLGTFEYDSKDRVIGMLDADDNRVVYGYDLPNHKQTVTDRRGNPTLYEYDNKGNVTKKTGADGNVTGWAYDDSGNRLSEKITVDGQEREKKRTYDGSGNALTETTVLEGGQELTTAYTYNGRNQVLTTEDAEGHVTENRYDGKGNLLSTADPEKNTVIYAYDADGNLETMTDAEGNDMAYTYDSAGNMLTEKDPPGNVTTYTYEHGNKTSETVWRTVDGVLTALKTTYDYYDDGRLRFVQTGDRKTVYTYTEAGFIETITAPDNVVTYFRDHDAVGRPGKVEISDPSLKTIRFGYDNNGNTTAIFTPGDIEHGFGFNNVNLNDGYDTPLSGSYVYKYDNDRRLTEKIFPSAESIVYDYDPDNTGDKSRLREIRPGDGTGTIFYDYYDCGTKVESVTRGSESVTYGYDGSLFRSEESVGTLNQTISYAYDNDGDFLPDSFSYGGAVLDLDYDNDGLLIGIGNFTIERDYDFGDGNNKNGLPWRVLESGTPILERGFSPYGETDSEAYTGGAAAFAWEVTERDNAGRIEEKTETAGGITASYVYDYDDLGRLRTVTKGGELVEEYRYDERGRRNYELNTRRDISRTSADDFVYDDEDCLTEIGGVTYDYDSNGFLGRRTDDTDITEYDYSLMGELLSVTLPDNTLIEYVHDPLGRRIAKKVNGTITEKYLWAGLTTLLVLYEYDGDNILTTRFEYAGGRMPVAMTKGGSRYYLAYDQVGSLRAVTDALGNAVKRIEYDSFGNIVNAGQQEYNADFGVPFGFAGGLYDEDTGLVRFGYRDYDPDTGRWTAKDPILFAGGDTDLYGYCLSDPVNWIDSEGKFATILGGFIGGAVAGGIAGGITSAAASYLSGDSLSGVLNSGLIGAGIGAGIGGIAGASLGAGLLGGLGFASDFGWGFAVGAGIGEHAALSSLLGAAFGGVASIFTDPSVCSNEKGPDPFDIYGFYGTGAGPIP